MKANTAGYIEIMNSYFKFNSLGTMMHPCHPTVRSE